jgi:hypothetical protein
MNSIWFPNERGRGLYSDPGVGVPATVKFSLGTSGSRRLKIQDLQFEI